MFHHKADWLLVFRENLERFSKDSNEYILEHCFYCKNCRVCSLNTSLIKELKRNKFDSENIKVEWWRIQFIDENKVVLSKNL